MRRPLMLAAPAALSALLLTGAATADAHSNRTPAASAGEAIAAVANAPTGTAAFVLFTARDDTTPQLTGGETSPRGYAVFTQPEDAANLNDLRVRAELTGLTPRTRYVIVAYRDPVCAPTPGVTAFPSTPFTTNRRGAASVRNLLLNPQALNPAATFDVDETRSVSIRQVLATTPAGTLPDGSQTEACDTAPFVN